MPQEPFGPLFGFEELVKGLVDGLEHTIGGLVDPDPADERRDEPRRPRIPPASHRRAATGGPRRSTGSDATSPTRPDEGTWIRSSAETTSSTRFSRCWRGGARTIRS
jgi:hypothetical protein